MIDSKRVFPWGLAAVALVGCSITLALAAKPPKADADRITRSDLGFSYVIPSSFYEKTETVDGVHPTLVLVGPHTNQTTTIADTGNYTLNEYLATDIALFVTPRGKTSEDFDQVAAATTAKAMLGGVNMMIKHTGLLFNYQNSALIDVNGHPALAVLAETSVPNVNDTAMVRFIFFNHRDKTYMFLFQTNTTEFETRVASFDAFIHSLKFLQPNVAPTPSANKPIDIKIGQ